MRVLVVMAAYNEEEFIGLNINNLYPYVDKIAVSTSKHITGEDSTDFTRQEVENLINTDTYNKIILRDLVHNSGKTCCFDEEEGLVKTELMNSMEPENGDWIWVVDADEFYSQRSLEMLRSRYILNHQMITKYGKECILMQAMCFAYNINHFYWARHGRMFLYEKGSYFSKVNHLTRANGKKIYGDEFGWDMPPLYMHMYHMRYVRRTMERLRGRYEYREDPAGQLKLKWFDNVFKVFPYNSYKALQANKDIFHVDGFDGAMLGQLKDIKDPDIPDCLQTLNIDLWNELQWRAQK